MLALALLITGCSEPPPSTEDVGARVVAPPPPRDRRAEDELYDARGIPRESNVRVAGLTLPRGLTEQQALSSDRLHVFASEVPRDRLLRYFGPRLTTMEIEQRGDMVSYRDAIPREARGGVVHLDVTIHPSSSHAARVEIYERPPRLEQGTVSEDDIRRHLESLTKNRE
jgi:hypothetical protein